MTVWDTSAIIPLFDPDHEHHAAARRRFEEAEEVWLHPCVVLETTTYIRRQAKDQGGNGNRVAREFLAGLLNQPRVRVAQEMNADAAVEKYLGAGSLSFTDACVLALAQSRGMALVAFDRRLGKAATR